MSATVGRHAEKPNLTSGNVIVYVADAARFLHLLSRHRSCIRDTREPQTKFVGIGRAAKSFIEGDKARLVEVKERLVEGLHAVLRSSGRNGIADAGRLVFVKYVVADERS